MNLYKFVLLELIPYIMSGVLYIAPCAGYCLVLRI
jgi:hypothetical protein